MCKHDNPDGCRDNRQDLHPVCASCRALMIYPDEPCPACPCRHIGELKTLICRHQLCEQCWDIRSVTDKGCVYCGGILIIAKAPLGILHMSSTTLAQNLRLLRASTMKIIKDMDNTPLPGNASEQDVKIRRLCEQVLRSKLIKINQIRATLKRTDGIVPLELRDVTLDSIERSKHHRLKLSKFIDQKNDNCVYVGSDGDRCTNAALSDDRGLCLMHHQRLARQEGRCAHVVTKGMNRGMECSMPVFIPGAIYCPSHS